MNNLICFLCKHLSGSVALLMGKNSRVLMLCMSVPNFSELANSCAFVNCANPVASSCNVMLACLMNAEARKEILLAGYQVRWSVMQRIGQTSCSKSYNLITHLKNNKKDESRSTANLLS